MNDPYILRNLEEFNRVEKYEAQYTTPAGIKHLDIVALSDRSAKIQASRQAPIGCTHTTLWAKGAFGMRFKASRKPGDVWKNWREATRSR